MDAARTCGGALPSMASAMARSGASSPLGLPSTSAASGAGMERSVASAASVRSGWSAESMSPRACASRPRYACASTEAVSVHSTS